MKHNGFLLVLTILWMNAFSLTLRVNADPGMSSPLSDDGIYIPIDVNNNPHNKWYVGNNTDKYVIDFSDINTAMVSDDVKEGDTILVCMNDLSYLKEQKVSKKVVVMGNGYSTSAATQPLDIIYMDADSAQIMNIGIKDGLYINNDNITVRNCYINGYIYGNETSNENDNCIIHGCFITRNVYGNGDKGTDGWTFTNNISLRGMSNFEDAIFDHNTIVVTGGESPNCLEGITESTITNNILYGMYFNLSSFTGCTVMKNLLYGDSGADAKANSAEINDLSSQNTYFTSLKQVIACTGTTSSEEYFKSVGLAIGYSTDGTDCGAYGGTDPYKLGGTTPYVPEEVEEIEPNDLLALKNLYERYNGTNWSTYKWNISSTKPDDYPGVKYTTVDNKIRVQEVDLHSNNLQGNVTEWTVYLPYLTYLNLKGNKLYGDITKFLSELSSLKTLDISYNMLSGLKKLPKSVATLYKGYQNVDTEGYYRGDISQLYTTVPTLYICNEKNWPYYYMGMQQLFTEYSIVAFDLETDTIALPELYEMNQGKKFSEDYLNKQTPIVTSEGYTYSTTWLTTPYIYNYTQDHDIYVASTDHSVFPAKLRYAEGDANMDGMISVLDVQTTINYILVPSILNLFGYTPANTYLDKTINVQDVVCTVNILLSRSNSAKDAVSLMAKAMARNVKEDSPVEGSIYIDGNSLRLNAEKEVAALDIEIDGATTSEVGLMLNRNDFNMTGRNTDTGSHYLIYSLSGKTIPTVDTQILRLSKAGATIASVALSTADAKDVNVEVKSVVTGISNIDDEQSVRNGKFIENGRLVIKSAKGTYNAAGIRLNN